ncbi:hypothetical protein [Longispora fulva]|uniref:Uncharacterized protein n=1 Tax=Longispora fulva TaxID=619741 RepID=A0A8J7GK57_9ACTN|nr:hypothetical protein [Longispora fulva]MBG6134444.1 hypothetical protein [Longispora fulva]
MSHMVSVTFRRDWTDESGVIHRAGEETQVPESLLAALIEDGYVGLGLSDEPGIQQDWIGPG